MSDHRTNFIASLREFANLLEANPDLPVPYYSFASVWAENEEHGRNSRHGVHGWKKNNRKEDGYFSYSLPIGGEEFGSGTITYTIMVPKSEVCKKVQVGTRMVEAVEAHEEPVYEWVCGPESEAATDEPVEFIPEPDAAPPF